MLTENYLREGATYLCEYRDGRLGAAKWQGAEGWRCTEAWPPVMAIREIPLQDLAEGAYIVPSDARRVEVHHEHCMVVDDDQGDWVSLTQKKGEAEPVEPWEGG